MKYYYFILSIAMFVMTILWAFRGDIFFTLYCAAFFVFAVFNLYITIKKQRGAR